MVSVDKLLGFDWLKNELLTVKGLTACVFTDRYAETSVIYGHENDLIMDCEELKDTLFSVMQIQPEHLLDMNMHLAHNAIEGAANTLVSREGNNPNKRLVSLISIGLPFSFPPNQMATLTDTLANIRRKNMVGTIVIIDSPNQFITEQLGRILQPQADKYYTDVPSFGEEFTCKPLELILTKHRLANRGFPGYRTVSLINT